jgi:hypothetical protein
MTLHPEYFEEDPCDVTGLKARAFHTLRGFAAWVEKYKPDEIEMTEKQFWYFTCLQPLHAGEEKYWTTFHGIPIRVPEMSEARKTNLKLI